jgi:mono/diheme cytochrome c family protein
VGQGDVARGKQLFLATTSKGSCASCHTLADAKSNGTLGPNLDDAFSGPKAQGVGSAPAATTGSGTTGKSGK